MFDIGAGGGALSLTGDGFENQTHPILTPLALTVTPFGFVRSEKWAKWGRVVRLKFAEKYVLGDITAADFHSPATYLRQGEFAIQNSAWDSTSGRSCRGRISANRQNGLLCVDCRLFT